ncbi:MAG TPA: glycosyltransferase family 2 protein [Gemmatimonadaceae bacterium]
MTAPITILIPTFNRRRALSTVLPSYLSQSGVARVIVVDDGSTDGTEQMVEEIARRSAIPLTVIRHATRRGQPAARLTAIAASDTEWVLFGEDDVWLDNDYCGVLLRDAQALDASIIGGRSVTGFVPAEFSEELLVDPPSPEVHPDRVFDLTSMEADFAARVREPVRAPFLHTWALINRRVFEKVSFDTWYTGNSWREETDFYLAANAAGEKVYFTPNTVSFHLRGPICATGGQRINRVRFEYLAWRNTRYLVSKHWSYLKRAHGMRGSALRWMLRYYLNRELGLLRRAARSGLSSSFRGRPQPSGI